MDARIDLAAARARWGPELETRLTAALAGEGLLAEMLSGHVAAGGKRLRALLPVWIAAELGGVPADALDLGVGLELLHNATLIHDDLQDGDVVRRGHPTVWKRYGAAQAINAGDAMYFLGLSALLRAPAGPRTVAFASEAMTRVIEGQVLEFQLQDDPADHPPTPEGWREMAARKTGALFSACFHAGASAAGHADPASVAAWGEALGLLFQVQDDLLDLVGDKGRARRGTDLAEGKRSYPVCWALCHGAAAPAGRLAEIVGAPRDATDDAMIAEGIALLESTGALAASLAHCRALARRFEAEAPVRLSGLVDGVLAPIRPALDAAAG